MSSHLARSIGSLWHRLLLFLGIRNEFDWAAPGLGPEVNHPYMPHPSLRCCEHCGGGRKNWIHRPPYDPRRVAEILGSPPYPMKAHERLHGLHSATVEGRPVLDFLKDYKGQ